jgi:hypothetical protein
VETPIGVDVCEFDELGLIDDVSLQERFEVLFVRDSSIGQLGVECVPMLTIGRTWTGIALPVPTEYSELVVLRVVQVLLAVFEAHEPGRGRRALDGVQLQRDRRAAIRRDAPDGGLTTARRLNPFLRQARDLHDHEVAAVCRAVLEELVLILPVQIVMRTHIFSCVMQVAGVANHVWSVEEILAIGLELRREHGMTKPPTVKKAAGILFMVLGIIMFVTGARHISEPPEPARYGASGQTVSLGGGIISFVLGWAAFRERSSPRKPRVKVSRSN